MKVSQRQLLPESLHSTQPRAAPGDALPAPARSGPEAYQQQMLGKTTSVAKLFATENQYAMLLRPDPAPPGGDLGPAFLLSGSTLTTLQVLDRATGGVMRTALADNMMVTKHSQVFPLKVRICTVDEAGANLHAEKNNMGSRDLGWSHIYLPCAVHRASRCHQKSFSLLEEHVSGMLNFSLSLSVGSSLSRFRKSMAAVITEEGLVTIVRDACPPAAVRYRQFVLELFCSKGANAALKQYLLRRLPNGDWRRKDRIEVFVEPGVDVDAVMLEKHVITALLLCLGGRNFRVYPRHRWLGCDLATDMVGLCLSVHGLAARAYSHMQMHQPSAQARATEHEDPAGDPEGRVRGPTQAGRAAGSASSAAGHLDVGEWRMLDDEETLDADRAPGPRPSSCRRATNHGLGRSQCQATTESIDVAPGRSLAPSHCTPDVSGSIEFVDWVLHHHCRRGLATGAASQDCQGHERPRGYSWEHPAQAVGRHGSSEDVLSRSLFASNLLWLAVHRADSVDTFLWVQVLPIALEDGVCSAYGAAHQVCSLWALSLGDWGASQAGEAAAVGECCQDSYTQAHLARYPGEALVSDDSLQCLEAILTVGSTETVSVEWGYFGRGLPKGSTVGTLFGGLGGGGGAHRAFLVSVGGWCVCLFEWAGGFFLASHSFWTMHLARSKPGLTTMIPKQWSEGVFWDRWEQVGFLPSCLAHVNKKEPHLSYLELYFFQGITDTKEGGKKRHTESRWGEHPETGHPKNQGGQGGGGSNQT